ncbi:hypothetical protein B9479_007892 [Cryptococcus floricola]|uniref:Uncharacterized protein n=1 Tax=Cryptococcus floricola TaxID=2591691 RepID=A0A5D3APD1_9TREE|nr:hypothetical protein B9479_007892 [Cryptococcus floricola]
MERLPTPSLLIHTLPQPLISSRSPAFAALCPLRPPHRPTVPHLLSLLRFLAVSSRQFSRRLSEGSEDEVEVVVEHSWKRHGEETALGEDVGESTCFHSIITTTSPPSNRTAPLVAPSLLGRILSPIFKETVGRLRG